MTLKVTESINASADTVWQIITDIDNAQSTIEGIIDITVLERPAEGLRGLKWRETRKMFGKEATEEMTISAVEESCWYETHAENHGTIYKSRMEVVPTGANRCELSMSFEHTPVSTMARIMSLFSFLFSGPVKKMIAADLSDIKRKAEDQVPETPQQNLY